MPAQLTIISQVVCPVSPEPLTQSTPFTTLPVLVAGLTQVSSFSDGNSYSLGIGRKISDDLSVSISGFYDGSSGGSISELAPTGATKTLSLGGKYAIADNADLSIGGSYSQRGDALTSNYKASLTDSKVISLGAKLAFSF